MSEARRCSYPLTFEMSNTPFRLGKLRLAKVVGSVLLDLVCHLYRSWGTFYYNVMDIQATFDEVESRDGNKDRNRAIQWFQIFALSSLQYPSTSNASY